ncbi:unnamed protein product [Dicrocoelium dendriticum]|nr:unnamed protein product [Dicrocoelium dendriticum]
MYRVPMKTNVITGNDGCKLTNGFMLLLIFSYWTPTYDAAHVVQSSRCTAEERKNHIQCFEVLPEEQYSAPLGSTVNMQCVVLNQHGKVQWRAKQVLLGYDRSVPSNSRYRIIGDVSRGEHTLQIMDIELQDAGEYECQVTPVPANNHPLLRRKTILVVLVKPAPPRILYPDVPPPDNQLIISQLDPIVRITVLCVALDGSPPPNFTWIHNGREIPISTPQTSTKRVVPKQGQWTSLAPIIQTQNERGESRISLLKAGLRDGDHLMCSVTNAATQLHHDVHQRNLTTAVTIRVHSK